MKIIVTGGAGFIGSNFILQQLEQPNIDILNIDKLTYAGNLHTLEGVADMPNYSFLQADISNKEMMAEAIENYRPDYIVNFAAESHVDRSIDGPFEFIHTNIVGTAVLLNAALQYYNALSKECNSNFRFLHVSTDEVFGSLSGDGLFTETTPYDPSSPYSASKASSDHLVRAWHRTYGLPALITNCSNNYGPCQFPEKLIPLMVLNCLAEKPLPVYGKGENVRDWLYVIDHCEAISVVLNKGKLGDTYNIGGNNEMKNIDIVITICDIMDEKAPRSNGASHRELITFVTDRPGHDFRYAIDTAKINGELGWSPKESFQSGINKTIDWYLNNKKWWTAIQNNTYQQERLGVPSS